MNTEPSGKTILPWGKKGEFLVAIQFVLLLTFMILPVYPSCSGLEIFSTTTMLRWTVLRCSWIIAILFGTLGLYQIKHSLTPLPTRSKATNWSQQEFMLWYVILYIAVNFLPPLAGLFST